MSNALISNEDVTEATQTQVGVVLGTATRTYRLWETTAPARYDYHGTLHIYGDVTPDKGSSRFVLIPDDDQYQVGRYGSGLYGTRRSNTFDAGDVSAMLLTAFYGALYKGGD